MWPDLIPFSSVSPVKENSSSGTWYPFTKRHAVCRFVGTFVQERLRASPSMPCCCKVWSSNSGDALWDTTSRTPGFGGSCSKIIFNTSLPCRAVATLNCKIHSPLKANTSNLINRSQASSAIHRRLFSMATVTECANHTWVVEKLYFPKKPSADIKKDLLLRLKFPIFSEFVGWITSFSTKKHPEPLRRWRDWCLIFRLFEEFHTVLAWGKRRKEKNWSR